jgi:hypothetical protein
MKDNKDIQVIENNYDNLGILRICKYLLGVVINDIEYMNSDIDKDTSDLLLGNNTYIEREDLESICSILDTINDIEEYNKESD